MNLSASAERARAEAGRYARPSEAVRDDAAIVAHDAQFVRINRGALFALAERLTLDPRAAWSFRNEHHFWGEHDDVVAYVVTLSAINFGSGYAPYLRRPTGSTYFTVSDGWKRWFEQLGRAPHTRELRSLGGLDCARIFGQDYAQPRAAELMDAFAANLARLADLLDRRFDGRCVNLLPASAFDAQRIVANVCDEPPYADQAQWHSLTVHFHKRAQLLAADLARAGRDGGWFEIANIGALTLFADNAVAQVLAAERVLEYAPSLAAMIERGEEVPAGSIEEIEIRACSIAAAEMMLEQLRRKDPRVTIIELDYALWDISHRPPYSDGRVLRHLTRTLAY